MREIVVLAQALGVALADGVLDEAIALVDSLPAESTASMQHDVIAGQPSELDAQTSAVVGLAREAGVDAPTDSSTPPSFLTSWPLADDPKPRIERRAGRTGDSSRPLPGATRPGMRCTGWTCTCNSLLAHALQLLPID